MLKQKTQVFYMASKKFLCFVILFNLISTLLFLQETTPDTKLNEDIAKTQPISEEKDPNPNLLTKETLEISPLTEHTETEADPNFSSYNIIRETEDGMKLYQKLVWETIPDILGYNFLLEQKNKKDKWEELINEFTEESFREVSLPPGEYRYTITVINVLNQVESVSDFRNFTVKLARQPRVDSISPNIIYFENENSGIFSVKGVGLIQDTKYIFKAENSKKTIVAKVLSVDDDEEYAKIQVNMKDFEIGSYNFIVKDVSRLEDKTHHIVFKFQKPVDFYLSAGYVFSGFAPKNVFTRYLGITYFPVGGIGKFTVAPFKRQYGSFGFSLDTRVTPLNVKTSDFDVSGIFVFSYLNAVYIRDLIKRRLSFEAHIGVGVNLLTNLAFMYGPVKITSRVFAGFSVNTGVALRVFIVKRLYLETEFSYLLSLGAEFPTHIFQPAISIGWSF